MTEIEQLLQTLYLSGIRLWPQEGKLRYRGPQRQLTPARLSQLQQHKDALLHYLCTPTYAPLSYGQKGLWYIQQSAPDSFAYHVSLPLRIRSTLDLALFNNAVQLLVNRHAALRTTFPLQDHAPVQKIAGYQSAAFTVVDATGWAEETLLAAVKAEHERPFDLAAGPFFRVTVFAHAPQDHLVLISTHHLVIDGWSSYLLLDELFVLYDALRQGGVADLPIINHTYADYVAWQQALLQSEGERLWHYWQSHLSGELPVLQLPTDYSRPPLQSYRGISHVFKLSANLTQSLKRLAQQHGCTLYMVLLAAYQVLLHRYSGQEDLIVGLPMAGRSRPEFANVVGYFTSPVVVRTKLGDTLSFPQLLAQVRRQVLGALDHQDYPFPLLVEQLNPARDLSRAPVFQADFVLQKPHRAQELFLAAARSERSGLVVERVPLALFAGQVDLALEIMETPTELLGQLNANADLFAPETVERMAGHFATLLQGIVDSPDQPIVQLPLLTAAEQQQLLVEWNDTATDYATDKCIHYLFEEQVERTPDAVAVVGGDKETRRQGEGETFASTRSPGLPVSLSPCLTYAELNARANQLAHYLQTLGVGGPLGAETLVGLCVERSIEMIVGMLGILKAGGAYVPLDPSYPQERLAFMLQDAATPVLLTQAHLRDRLPPMNVHVLYLDQDWPQIARQSSDNPVSGVAADHTFASLSTSLAYVIYTSGSTGQPKGALNTHRGLSNLLHALQATHHLTAADKTLQTTTFSFDVATAEIFWPLVTGASLVLTRPDGQRDSAYLVAMIRQHEITTLHVAPSLLRMLVEEPAIAHCTTLKRVIAAGEALPFNLQQHFFARLNAELHNWYGPTETAVYVTAWQCQRHSPSTSVPIGRPIANTQAYILDAHLRPVPIGVPGELHIGGIQVGRGYHKRPELTQAKFIANPLGAGQLYKTGDLTCWLSDGTIEYLGRLDHQVKVRGFRIELGEIEAVLAQHTAVQEAIVIAREDQPGASAPAARLVAYVVTDGKLASWQDDKGNSLSNHPATSSELRDYLKQKLPEYMIPSTFIVLEAMPLTPNGKVDRKALPAPDHTALTTQTAFEAPQTPTEARLASIWGEVLGVTQVGRQDNFFALGGHSLLATQVVSRVRQAFALEMPLRLLFEAATVAGLAAAIERLRQTASEAEAIVIPRVDRTQPLPLSPAQERLWFLDQLGGAHHAYTIPSTWRLYGKLDRLALEQSLQALVWRHASLRTTFTLVAGKPVQVIQPPAFTLSVIDLTGWAAPAAEVERLIRTETSHPFDLTTGPLFRATLVGVSAQEHLLLLTFHHSIADGWSLEVFQREVAALYTAFRQGQPSPLAELPIQYADFAAWQRTRLTGEAMAAQLNYWEQQLIGAPPLLTLPTDRPRPPVQSYNGAHYLFSLPPTLTEAIRRLSLAEGATLFMTLLAAFKVLLMRYSGQDDLVVGTPIANRHHLALEPLIGLFVNTLALRSNLAGQPSFRALLAQIKETTLDAYRHQDTPFEQIVDRLQPQRTLSHSPLFQVMFDWLNQDFVRLELPELTVEPVIAAYPVAKFDLTLMMLEKGQQLIGSFEYNTDLFDAASIERMAGHLQTLLGALVANPDQPITQLPLLTEAEQHQLLVQWNDTTMDYPAAQCIHQLFEEQVERTPDAVALILAQASADKINGDSEVTLSLTYRELNTRANQLAHYLQTLGVGGPLGAETLVGLCVERSLEMVIGLLGILKAGGAYVPLDPTYPQERLRYMLRDSQASVLLTQAKFEGSFTDRAVQTICLDTGWSLIAQHAAENPIHLVHPNHLAYVIYTSGSTGQPKGVLIEQQALATHIANVSTHYGITAQDRVLQFAAFHFDTAQEQIFTALCNGAALILRGNELWTSEEFNQQVAQHRITVADLPPVYFQQLLRGWQKERPDFLENQLRLILLGGEQIQPEIIRLWRQIPASETQLFNVYGPTEATITTTRFDLTHYQPEIMPAHLPIGKPLSGRKVYILDRQLQPVPIGVTGELSIGGHSLARGYLNRPALTAEKFIANPFPHSAGCEKLYKTGDLARWLSDGTIELLGRSDQQIKLHGFRIELGEIESVLAQHPAVQAVTVLLHSQTRGQQRLVAYVATDKKTRRQEDKEIRQDEDASSPPLAVSSSDLRGYLQNKLPDYMIPSTFVLLDALPLTANGKIDRKALAALGVNGTEDGVKQEDWVKARTPLETELAAIWCQVLQRERVSIHDNFFSVGGDSILSLQVVSYARQLGIQLSPQQIFQQQTIAELCTVLEPHVQQSVFADSQTRVAQPWTLADQALVSGAAPLTPLQQYWTTLALPNPDIYHQSILMVLDNAVEPAVLRQALQILLRYHDALRLRYRPTTAGWQGEFSTPTDDLFLLEIDMADAGAFQPQIAKATVAIEQAMHLQTGPLLGLALFRQRNGGPSHLLWIIHHLVVDWVSWRILLADLETVYGQLRQGRSPLDAVRLPAKTTTFQQWARWLHERAPTLVAPEVAYWVSRFQGVQPLPRDLSAGEPTWASLQAVTAELSVAETQALLQQAPAAYQTQINDLLLTALLQTWVAWTHQPSLLIELESHGREPIQEARPNARLNGADRLGDASEIDLSRTVGWFTAAFPVRLDYQAGDLGMLIKAVKQQLRQIPNHGLGFGVLRYLQQEPSLTALPMPAICFNYLGQFDQSTSTGNLSAGQTALLRGIAREGFAALDAGQAFGTPGFLDQNGQATFWSLFDLELMVVHGQLRLIWLYSTNVHQRSTVIWLTEQFMTNLRTLIAHCQQQVRLHELF